MKEAYENLLTRRSVRAYTDQPVPKETVEAIVEGVRVLRRRCDHLVIVSNEVFSGGSSYAGDTLHYLRVLARVNRLLAQEADEVYEIVYGLPVCHKGKGVRA